MIEEARLKILTDGAKYDVSCSSSGSRRKNTKDGTGNAAVGGLCHSFTQDGRCISLLKMLMSNDCVFDCKYCPNRHSADVPRASVSPREMCELVMGFYRRNYIEGLFLSSAVYKSPDYTMEILLQTIRMLREEYKFNGYIHLKGIPHADRKLTESAAAYADRMSYNVELPSEQSLKLLAPQKTKESVFSPMRQLCEEVIEPYYYDVLLPYDASYSDMVRKDELYTYYRDIDYDGKTLGAINDAVDIFKLGRNLHIWYSKYESGDPSVDWDDTTWRYTQRHGDEYTYHWLECDSRAEGLNNLEFYTYTWNRTYEDGVRWPTDIHGVRQYRAAYTQGICKSVWISEGDAVYVADDYRDGMIYGSVCLENGEVTLRTGDGRYETTFPVVNGRAQPGTDVEVEMRSDENGNVYASALLWHTPDGETLRIGLQTHWGQSADASNAEELYHIIVLERMSIE